MITYANNRDTIEMSQNYAESAMAIKYERIPT